MKREQKRALAWGGVILFAVVGAWFFISRNSGTQSLNQPQPSFSLGGETRNDNGEGNVTVTASVQESGGELKFLVQFDTHSVSLDDFDAGKRIILVSQNGAAQMPEIVASSGLGHHRELELSFASIQRPYRLIVMNLAGVPVRELVWE